QQHQKQTDQKRPASRSQPDAPSSAAAAYRQRSEAVKFAALSDLPPGMANLLRPEREARFQEASEEVARLDSSSERLPQESVEQSATEPCWRCEDLSVTRPIPRQTCLTHLSQCFKLSARALTPNPLKPALLEVTTTATGQPACDDTEALRHKKGHRSANGTGVAAVADAARAALTNGKDFVQRNISDGDSNSSDCETELPIETDYELYRLRSSEAKQLAEIEARLQAMSPNRQSPVSQSGSPGDPHLAAAREARLMERRLEKIEDKLRQKPS
uniref:PH domain-containing protein n=1 Tax=Macrostomum lignano TaxID=282301 RepID=A0A1I8FJC5_9PLAT